MFNSIRSKLTFTHLSVVALVALILGVLAYARLAEQLRYGLEERLRHYSEDMGDRLEELVESRRSVLDHIANGRELEDYIHTKDKSALASYFTTYSDDFHRLYFIEANGTLSVMVDDGRMEEDLGYLPPSFSMARVVEEKGKVAVRVEKHISPLEDLLTLSSAVYSHPQGSFEGVVAGTVDWPHVASWIEDYPKEPYVNGAIVDHDGRVLVHPDLTQVGSVPPDFLTEDEASYGTADDRLYSGMGLFFGRRHIYACYEMVDLGWKVYSIYPYRRFKELPTEFRDQIILIFLATCLVGGILSAMVARGISRPLLQLSRQARRVSEGRETKSLPVPVEDEVGRLVRAFNHMTESLNRTTVSRNRVDTILESIREGLLVMDDRGQIIRVNSAACRLMECSNGDLVGHLFVPDVLADSGPATAAVQAVRNGKRERAELEASFQRRDGTEVPVLLSYVPLKAETGEFSGAVCTATDMTAIRRSEEERIQLQAQVYQAQKLETVGTLAGGVAHDFNDNLSVTVGYLELALKGIGSEDPVREFLEKAHLGTERCRDIVRQLLTFSRKLPVENKVLSLAEVLGKTLRLMRGNIPPGVIVDVESGGTPGLVEGDETQLHQVVMNLTTNAVQAMEASGGILLLRVDDAEVKGSGTGRYPDLPKGSYVRLTVSDNGHGMSPSTMERIFDPFFSTKPADKGTGLGLSVVHGIVKAMKGGIYVDSAPKVGSTFEVLLPLTTRTATPEVVSVGEAPFGNERILCVDDDDLVLEMLREVLQDMGYAVTTFRHPRMALENFRQGAGRGYDLVILDENMPVLTGRELARRMFDIRPGIPVVIYSGYLPSMTEEEMRESGVSRFLAKPLGRVELGTVVRTLLDEQRGVTPD